jgi:hypothetical protein
MSHRDLKRDANEERAAAFDNIGHNQTQEAMWEAIEIIKSQGVDVGEKADLVLKKRAEVKRAVKKP